MGVPLELFPLEFADHFAAVALLGLHRSQRPRLTRFAFGGVLEDQFR